ncbi:MAG: hypothetical protein ACTTKY_12580 [Catonella sp.]
MLFAYIDANIKFIFGVSLLFFRKQQSNKSQFAYFSNICRFNSFYRLGKLEIVD